MAWLLKSLLAVYVAQIITVGLVGTRTSLQVQFWGMNIVARLSRLALEQLIALGDKLIAPFILGCGSCRACQIDASNTCESKIVPGFGAPSAYAEFVAVLFDHNLVHSLKNMSPALAAGLGCRVTTAWHALNQQSRSTRG